MDVLTDALEADFDKGVLTWRERPRSHFASDRACKTWNTRFAGKRAFTAKNSMGYYHGAISGRHYLAHRVIWALKEGRWPSEEIDHADGNPRNNAASNLRQCTRSQNNMNRVARGVSRNKRSGKWVAYYTVNRKTQHVGTFATEEAAIAARNVAASAAFGEFAMVSRDG